MKKFIPITVLCLFTLQCEQGWIKDILSPEEEEELTPLEVVVSGCIDDTACNYNSEATVDDGSCLTNDCAGECGGLAVVDECGVCDGSGLNEDGCCGEATTDCTGLCGGPYSDCSVYDIDGNGYTTVTIGTQEWLVQNLKTTKYNDGIDISTGYSNSEWSELQTGAYAVYPIDGWGASQSICGDDCADVFGNLYNWYTVDDDRGICPEGWHVPSEDEWRTLTGYLGGTYAAGGKMKEAGHEHWDSPNFAATNESGFTGLPAGFRPGSEDTGAGLYNWMGVLGFFWSSSENTSYSVWAWRLVNNTESADGGHSYRKQDGLSIRCLKD